ncbi:Aste57867_15585 [Aphanomyces stellatus]|uniref:Aste57867_15585 protein n=1 Tax=Aphanomyces stellatus TaxID=120398 RepID=A0A485L3G9_9STRA|nr:hypothetical protein As57867_015529 [Aphanomyces stellatus]VFT92387.1 Aste57867_15585 [Aphanomyces stellatus]
MPVDVQGGKLVQRQHHSYSWATFMDATLPVDVKGRLSCIESILNYSKFKMCPQELLRELYFAKDMHGRQVIQITDEDTGKFLNSQLYYSGRYEIFEGPPVHVSNTAVVVMAYDHDICAQVFETYAGKENGELDIAGFGACNEILGPSGSNSMRNSEDHSQEEEMYQTGFNLWDKNASGGLSKNELLRYCAQQFGKVKVVLKKNADEYHREIKNRPGLETKVVVSFLPSVDEDTFKGDLKNLRRLGGYSMVDYPHVVVIPAADRNLDDIYRKECPGENERRNLLQQVAEALHHLHSKDLHEDVKKLNVVRVENRLKLIDLDATQAKGTMSVASSARAVFCRV